MHIKDARLYRQILQKADSWLSARANPANVLKYSRYFKDGYNAWGNDVSQINLLADNLLEEYPDLTMFKIIEIALLLFQHGKYEMGSLAIRLIELRLKTADRDSFDGIKSCFDFGVNNWAHADYLCSKVTPHFLKIEIVDLQDYAPWIESDSRWTRRAAPVSLIKSKKDLDVDALLAFVKPLMTDPERVVHQGTGWFLRELWKIHPQKVEDFLYSHRNTAARLIIQYATEKLSKSERLRFRKDKAPKSKG